MASTGLLIAGLASAAAGGVGAGLQANAAGKAATTQAQAAEDAAQLQAKAQQQALQLQQEQLGLTTANESPFINVGTGAINDLARLMGVTPTDTNPIAQNII